MKSFVLYFMLFSFSCLFSFLAMAAEDSFEISKDGFKYLCAIQTSSGSAADCANRAYSGPFTRDESTQLCTGARSVGPATCAIAAYAGPLSKAESIKLCIYARSSGPFDCFRALYSGPFSKDESIRACSNNGDKVTSDCVLRAYAGPYSKEEAIKICSQNAALLNVAFSQLHREKTQGFDSIVEKANLKALSLQEFRVDKTILTLDPAILSLPQK